MAAVYPAIVAILLSVLPVVQPRDGLFALAAVLSMHLALAALVLVPLAFCRDAAALRVALLALAFTSVVRFGDEWVSIPRVGPADEVADLAVVSWNLEFGARTGEAVTEGLRDLDVDVIALQELGPGHSAAIEADADLRRRFPYRSLVPMDGVLGLGLLSAFPIVSSAVVADPVTIEAVLDVNGRPLRLITSHPLPGRIATVSGLPVSFDPSSRDRAIDRFRARVDTAIARGETVIVVGDFNTSPTEPAYARLVTGLVDAHAAVGTGPGWTWRPSRFEGFSVGLLRIDVALSGPGVAPVRVGERCHLPGDHCQLEAWFVLDGR